MRLRRLLIAAAIGSARRGGAGRRPAARRNVGERSATCVGDERRELEMIGVACLTSACRRSGCVEHAPTRRVERDDRLLLLGRFGG